MAEHASPDTSLPPPALPPEVSPLAAAWQMGTPLEEHVYGGSGGGCLLSFVTTTLLLGAFLALTSALLTVLSAALKANQD